MSRKVDGIVALPEMEMGLLVKQTASDQQAISGKYVFNRGDVVYSKIRPNLRKAVLVDFDGLCSADMYPLKPTSNVDGAFILAVLLGHRFTDYAESVSVRSGIPKINRAEMAGFALALPPVSEQRAIAATLRDVDALLEGLERLIAKADSDSHHAAALMARRLPVHTGWAGNNWEIGHFLKGSGVKRDDAQSGNLACVRYGEIYTKHHDYVRMFHSRISSEVAATATRLDYGDLLFAGSGETKEEIGKCVALMSRTEAYAGGDIVILRPRNVDSLFFGYALNMPAVARQKAVWSRRRSLHISAAVRQLRVFSRWATRSPGSPT